MKRKGFGELPFMASVSAMSAVAVMIAAFIAGTYVEQALWGLPDRVNFRQCLPWFVVFVLAGFYFNSVFDLSRRIHHLFFSAFTSIVLVNILMMALPFFEVLYYVQITTLLIIFILECICMSFWILLFNRLWLYFYPPASTVIVFSGRAEKGHEIAKKISAHHTKNRVDKIIAFEQAQDLLGAVRGYDSVVMANLPAEAKNELALYCWENDKTLIVVPDIYDLILNNATLMQFEDLMAYRAKSIGLSQTQRISKRAMDIIGSLAALVLLSPLMLCVALVVRGDKGPAVFSQIRVTRDGRTFRLYKFRTMIPNAEKDTGPVLACREDDRITKAGRFLRQSRLDELPQFWNVLKGDMSLVGPRPEREHFISLYLSSLPEYQYRTRVRAGLTGLAHILGKYNTSPEERIKLDLTYIQNYSFFLDLKIIIETIRVVFTKEYAEGVDKPDPEEKEKETV